MANRAVQIGPFAGLSAAAFVAAVLISSLVAVILRADGAVSIGPSDWAAIRFTLTQAFVSALLSVAFAIPLASALARRQFPGRRFVIALLGAPFLLPVVVAVMGLLALFGRNGLINGALEAFGLPAFSVYGFHGVILAHVFLNLPLAARLVLQGWMAVPSERFRLAAQLSGDRKTVFKLIEVPMLRRVVPGAFAVVFALCLTSFAVVLTLGGGPRATTIELAIYQAFRFDFDLNKAAVLASIQLAIAGTAALVATRMTPRTAWAGSGLDRAIQRWDGTAKVSKVFDAFLILLGCLFLMLPIGAVLLRGIATITALPSSVWWAAFTSLWVAGLSVFLCLTLALAIGSAAALRKWRWLEMLGPLTIATSPLVLGTGLFILIFPFAAPQDWALLVTAGINAIMALPFALRLLIGPIADVNADYGKLAMSLGFSRRDWLRLIVFPRLRAPLGFAAGLSAALSMGDLGAVALFAGADQATLPLQMYRLMGAYKMDLASGAAVLLCLLSFGLFWMCDTWGRKHA